MMYDRGYGWGGYGNMMGGFGWVGALLLLLFAILVVVGIVLIVVRLLHNSSNRRDHDARSEHPRQSDYRGPTPPGVGPLPPLDRGENDEAVVIAKRRLATGEITVEQFQEIMRAMGA